MDVEPAPDVEERVKEIISVLSYDNEGQRDGNGMQPPAPSGRASHAMGHINEFRLICMRSRNATAHAYARIWNLPDIWQKALSVGAFYIIEVLSQHYDPLPEEEKEKVLIHELLHIPKTFSGALRPHHGTHVKINRRTVEELHRIYKERKKELSAKRREGLRRAEEAF